MWKSAVISLVGGFLLRLIFPQQSPPSMTTKPTFIEQVPPGHYLGISVECQQLAEAREDSIQNIIKQIFQQIGAEYNLEFEKETNAEDNQVVVNVSDRFSYNTAGLLADIEVKDSYYEKINGMYVFYALVYFPQTKIIRARKIIEEENSKRLAQYELFIEKGKDFESKGKIIDALNNYRYARNQAEYLFKGKDIKKVFATSNIENLLSRITLETVTNYNQRNRHYVICKALYNNKPVSDIPVRFQLIEGKGTITPVSYSNSDGFVQSDVNVNKEHPNNKIRAWINIEGVDANLVFNFSSVEPKPIISASPLEVNNNCFTFELKESNDVDVVFDQYEVLINAAYKNASFINYYIARVDNSKHASRSFNLLNPIKIEGGTSQLVKIPFNSWIKAKIDELDKWYMGSNLDYRIVLNENGNRLNIVE